MTLTRIPPRHEVTRRDALKLLAAGVAALETGCLERAGEEQIVPYVADPPELRPGVAVRYTSVLALDGFGFGIIGETREGRPVKLDGNPAHPASRGGSLPWIQARILDLYDPQRAPTASAAGATALRETPEGPLWLVLPQQSSPTVAALLARIAQHRELHCVLAAPLDHRVAYRGTSLVYGRPLELQLALGKADRILALDADFLANMPNSAAWARDAAGRRAPGAAMSRLWACEPVQTATGTLADEHLAIPARDVACVAVCVIDELATRGLAVPRLSAATITRARERLGDAVRWTRSLADDLATHRGRGAVIAGDRQPAIVHALARWIDHACGNVGGAVTLTPPALIEPPGFTSMPDFTAALAAGRVKSVVVLDGNPVYTVARAFGLGQHLAAVPYSLHIGMYRDQTALACKRHAPLAHELETWSDARAWDGTLAIGQPMIRPRFGTIGAIEALAVLAGDTRTPREIVRGQLQDPEAWLTALRTGVVEGTAAAPITVTPAWSAAAAEELDRAIAPGPAATIEIALALSPQIHDGRFAPNAWLQELPHPITKQTWGNAAQMSEAMAARLGVTDEQLVRLETEGGGEIEVPALIIPGAADGTIVVEVGYGQQVPAIPIADHVGADAFALRTEASWIIRGTARKAPGTARVVRTQHTTGEHGHEVAPVLALGELTPNVLAHLRGRQVSLLPEQEQTGVQWGMSIDTSICTGCSSCMVACQAENNIPTVGPDDVARGRHMNWIRIDRIVKDDGVVVNEPMPCQHCEHAPCEYVCPVMATTHSPDGLNEQAYNRCIGTRFCSNNCPYKVRRFNWFKYEREDSSSLQYNPDVTVRSRGVMEKCTYCVQRIRGAEHRALVEHRPLRTGEVVTACQQACPTGAIQFGQLAETGTVFARLRRDARRFEVLHDLGTVPRTQYLARIRNPKERG